MVKKSFVAKIKEIWQIEAVVASDNRISPTDLLKKISAFLSNGIQFAVAGGFARSIHAEPRATGDVDIVVTATDKKVAAERLIKAGFKHKDTLEYQKPKRIIEKYEFDGRDLDIIDFPNHPQFVDFLIKTSVKQAGYTFLGLEGVILTKLCSFRFKDKADIVDLSEVKPDLDVVKKWCSALGIMDRFSFMTEDHEGEK
jgi:hypothetical protein